MKNSPTSNAQSNKQGQGEEFNFVFTGGGQARMPVILFPVAAETETGHIKLTRLRKSNPIRIAVPTHNNDHCFIFIKTKDPLLVYLQ